MFWFLVCLLAIAASLFVVLPLLFGSRESGDDRESLNLTLYRERLSEHAASGADDLSILELDAQKDLLNDTASLSSSGPQLHNPRIALIAAVLVPLLALVIYTETGVGLGAWPDVELAAELEKLDPADPATARALVSLAEQRLAQKPDDDDLMFLLASAYSSLGEYERSAEQYGKLVSKYPDDPNLASHHAEVLFVADGRRFTQRSRQAVDKALGLNPADITMLEINAIGAVTEGDVAAAMNWFNRALASGATGRRAELIRLAMARISERSGEGTPPAEAGLRVIEVEVSAAETVMLPVDTVVFIYARAASGPPMPLAVQRMTLGDLPASVRLDESMAMMPGMGLSDFDEVVLVARASSTGNVAPSEGDYEARSAKLDISQGGQRVSLTIAEKLSVSAGGS